MHQANSVKPYVAGVIFSFVIGLSFVAVKICVGKASTLDIMTHRYNFAAVMVALFLLFGIRQVSLRGKNLGPLMAMGIFYILFMILQAIGLIFSDSTESAIQFAIIPMMVHIIAAIFLKEKTTVLQTICVVLSIISLVAMILFNTTTLEFNLKGTILLFFSSICLAINNVLMRYVRKSFTPFEVTAIIAVGGFLIFNIANLSFRIYRGNLAEYFQPLTDMGFLLAIAYLGVFCLLFSSMLMAYMQQHMNATNASIFGNISTAISVFAGVVVLGENIEICHIISTVLIIISAIGVNVFGRKDGGGVSHG